MVQFLIKNQGVLIIRVAVLHFSQPVPCQLIQGTVALGIEGNGPEQWNRIPHSTGRNQLTCTQIVGFHIVALHFRGKIVHVVVGIHSGLPVLAVKCRKSNIAIYFLTSCLGITIQIVFELPCIGIDVKGKFGAVEKGIPGNVIIPFPQRSLPDSRAETLLPH